MSLSPFNKNSIITAVNQNREVELDEKFLEVFRKAMMVSKETDGAFDITVAPLVNAWGFGFTNGIYPNPAQVDSLRRIVGYEKVSLVDGKVVKQDPRIMLDCSAVAKGYGADVVAAFLRSRGVKNFMVEIGGEIVTSGVNAERLPWKIGVTKPTDDSLSVEKEMQTILNVTDKAMATSGNYRRYYYKGGKKFAHTIDPMTGYPVQHNLLSATVLAKDCATADAYATSFMVMGLDKAKKVLERHPELMAYFIYSNREGQNEVWFSPSLKEKISE
jgi:thiamine biosynthesis lipoprotein